MAGDEARRALQHHVHDLQVVGPQRRARFGYVDDGVREYRRLDLGRTPGKFDVRLHAVLRQEAPGHAHGLGGDAPALQVFHLVERGVVFRCHHPAHRSVIRPGRAQVGDLRHVDVVLQDPVQPGDGAIDDALPDVARHLLRPDQDALDLRVVDVGVVGAAGDAQVVAGAHEQFLRGFLQAAFGDAEAQPGWGRVHVVLPCAGAILRDSA